jgi:hypothetical protein
MNCWNSFSCSWCYNFCIVNSWKALRMLAYFDSAMLWMYQIDSYALDLLAYFNSAMLWMYEIDSYALDLLVYVNSAMLWMYQIDNYALDLLAYFNSDGHIMSLGIASQWFIMWVLIVSLLSYILLLLVSWCVVSVVSLLSYIMPWPLLYPLVACTHGTHNPSLLKLDKEAVEGIYSLLCYISLLLCPFQNG